MNPKVPYNKPINPPPQFSVPRWRQENFGSQPAIALGWRRGLSANRYTHLSRRNRSVPMRYH